MIGKTQPENKHIIIEYPRRKAGDFSSPPYKKQASLLSQYPHRKLGDFSIPALLHFKTHRTLREELNNPPPSGGGIPKNSNGLSLG